MVDLSLQALASEQRLIWLIVVLAVLFITIANSLWVIGPTQVGLVRKRFSWRRLESGSPVALNGAAGYQADLLTAGLRFKLWPWFTVTRHPLVQIPAGQIGVVISQVGQPLPIGAKSAIYKPDFGSFQDIRAFIGNGGEKGVQRTVLAPGSVAAIHPVGFLVVALNHVYGVPVADEYVSLLRRAGGGLTHQTFGLSDQQMMVVRIQPTTSTDGRLVDMIGIVTTLEGSPSPKGAMANRLGDFDDIAALEASPNARDSDLVEAILNSKNDEHNNYQDFQAFLDAGGRIGLQHDPLLYGAYNLNPFLVSVEMVPMLVVNQGQVAVVKAFVGLATEDTSGEDFKFGSLVRPGHRGIWEEPLRTGKYAINPRVYAVEIVPTFILTLNWADETSSAHSLDKDLSPIEAKSSEGFVFIIDLQVQIHVPDSDAPRVISTVGTMGNLVNEVLQAAVGNHFRDKLQGMPAIDFIQKRADVQKQAQDHITERLKVYRVETRGVYIQDVVFPPQLVEVLTSREIANQQKATYDAERAAQDQRLLLEASRGRADQQSALAQSMIGVDIARNRAAAVQAAADGESYRLTKVGEASAVQTRAEGLAVAAGLEAQTQAVGASQAAVINVAKALAGGAQRFMPENLAITTGGGGDGIGLGPLIPQLMRFLGNWENGAGSGPRAPEPGHQEPDHRVSDVPHPDHPDRDHPAADHHSPAQQAPAHQASIRSESDHAEQHRRASGGQTSGRQASDRPETDHADRDRPASGRPAADRQNRATPSFVAAAEESAATRANPLSNPWSVTPPPVPVRATAPR